MASFVPAGEARHLMAGALILFRDDLAASVHLGAIDELDIRRPAPRGHQTVGRCAAVFIREDNRVAELPS